MDHGSQWPQVIEEENWSFDDVAQEQTGATRIKNAP
jgi:hypothetical protein